MPAGVDLVRESAGAVGIAMFSNVPSAMTSMRNRRQVLNALAVAFAMPWSANAQNRAAKELIAGISVLPWLTVGHSTVDSVRGPIQALMNASPRPWYREGRSEITGGSVMTVSTLAGDGMVGEKGLRILSMVFDPSKRLQLAIFMVQRGWKDANVNPLIQRISNRYSALAAPVRIQDRQSEASDYYVFFDMGRFIVEISIPQSGDLIEVNFTTKEIHARMRMADGTYELFKPYL